MNKNEGPWTVEIQAGSNGIFVFANGKKIAKRGPPGTKIWLSLERGWTVTDLSDGEIEVAHNGVSLH